MVTLVGAGPGGIELLTKKAENAIRKAEVVVYDRLVNPEILALIPDTAEKIDAGKKSALHLIPQYEMNKILLDKALEGKNVVRLKGGDSFLFGRGGEELELLCENNIRFEVIPGITSALAVPTYAGIPVTHRDYASSVHIITGHAREDKTLDIDFESYVKVGGTLVFLMGVSNLELIISGLLNAGMREDMPCAVVESGARPNQKKYVSVLSKIRDVAATAKSPAVIVVGEVCGLSDKFDWYDKLPLKGVKIAVTRPADRIGNLSRLLKENGADVIESPSIETISDVDENKIKQIVEEIHKNKWCVFTSPTGVKIVFESLLQYGYDSRIFGNCSIAAVGTATFTELMKYGISADVVPQKYDSGSLANELVNKKDINDGVLLLRAEECDSELEDIFNANSISYKNLSVYYTKFVPDKRLLKKIANKEIDYVTFTSASTVKSLMKTKNEIDTDNFIGVCIGEKTAKEADKYGIKYIISEKAEIESMIELIIKAVKK